MNAHSTFSHVLSLLERPTFKPVFPGYIAFRIKRAMLRDDCGVMLPDSDFPGAKIGEVESLGLSHYAMIVHVANGTRCRITVEPISDAPASIDPEALRDALDGNAQGAGTEGAAA